MLEKAKKTQKIIISKANRQILIIFLPLKCFFGIEIANIFGKMYPSINFLFLQKVINEQYFAEMKQGDQQSHLSMIFFDCVHTKNISR
jgi:hypothetical protein